MAVSPAITFAAETIAGMWDEAQGLMAAHHAEVGMLPGARFAPDRQQYVTLENLGTLKGFSLREGGHLIGYAVYLITDRHLHYPGTVIAMQDVLYVIEEARGRAAVQFLRWMDLELQRLGVEFVIRHVTDACDYSRTLHGIGYHPVSRTFVKEL